MAAPEVTWLDRRKHAKGVLALEHAAFHDPNRLYATPDGKQWHLTELVDFLRRGSGLVVTRGASVEGFALYSVGRTAITVEKLVCPDRAVELLLLEALEMTCVNASRREVLVPFVIDIS